MIISPVFGIELPGLLALSSLPAPQALVLPQHSGQIFTKINEKSSYDSAVPGDSPVKAAYCSVDLRGHFTTSLINTTAHISFNVTSHFQDGRTGLVRGEDEFCNWVDIVQDGATTKGLHSSLTPLHMRREKLRCPPDEGSAKMSSAIQFLGGFVPEANYTVNGKATERNRTIFDLWTEFEPLEKDGFVSTLWRKKEDGLDGAMLKMGVGR